MHLTWLFRVLPSRFTLISTYWTYVFTPPFLPSTHMCCLLYPLKTQLLKHPSTDQTHKHELHDKDPYYGTLFCALIPATALKSTRFFRHFLSSTQAISAFPPFDNDLCVLELPFVLPLRRQLWSPQGFFGIFPIWHIDDFDISLLSNTEEVCPNFSSFAPLFILGFLCKIWFLWEYFLRFLLFRGILNASDY